jgi:hypothetical protein
MNYLILAVIVYLAYLFTWLMINLVFYFFSLAFKKRAILNTLTGLGIVALYIFNLLTGVSLLWLAISLLLDSQFLWFFIMIMFGIGLIAGILNVLQAPFIIITSYFTEKIEKVDFKENTVTAEILDKDNKVVGKVEGSTTVSTRLAKYFVSFFLLNLISIFLFPEDGVKLAPLDYIVKPAMQVIGGTLIFGIPYGIYRLIRYKRFFPEDKRYFYIQVWKINLIIFIPFVLIGIFLILIYS